MDEIEKNKNGKCLRIYPLTSPDEDELIKRLSKILKHPTKMSTYVAHFLSENKRSPTSLFSALKTEVEMRLT